MRGLPPTVRGTPQDRPVLRYAVQKGGGAPPRRTVQRTVQDGCHGKSTSISLSRGHPFAKIGGAYIATAMRSLLCGGCHAKSSCRHRAGCTLAEYVAPCISRWPTVRHGQPHKGAGRTTWAPISKAMAAWEETNLAPGPLMGGLHMSMSCAYRCLRHRAANRLDHVTRVCIH